MKLYVRQYGSDGMDPAAFWPCIALHPAYLLRKVQIQFAIWAMFVSPLACPVRECYWTVKLTTPELVI